jgi:hypothetical protein
MFYLRHPEREAGLIHQDERPVLRVFSLFAARIPVGDDSLPVFRKFCNLAFGNGEGVCIFQEVSDLRERQTASTTVRFSAQWLKFKNIR